MKARLIFLIIGLTGSLGFSVFRASAELEVSAGVSIHATSDFYAPLTPSGAWVEVGSYGRCWRPAGVAVGWRPYCNGQWEWTDCGWYWVSDEPWAWACYHYGTWAYDSGNGWVWVPGIEWAPAWVYWRMGGDYIGWAPCGPTGIKMDPSFFVFVESQRFHEQIRPDTLIVNNTLVFNKTTESSTVRRENLKFDGREQAVMVNEGPHVDVVEKATGQKFTAVSVREADRQTSATIPEQIKHQTTGPVNSQSPSTVHETPIPAPDHNLTPGGNPEVPHNVPPNKEMPPQQMILPDRTIPQAPSEKIIPPPNKESPLDKNNRPPNEVNPPQQSQTIPSNQARPSEKEHGNDDNKDDKDHGHDNQ